ncbi:MAG: asparagine synthase (glutamine-hydrolyzing) [Planctomycetia bacterium]|nr:asparagine synthase (glutamine-hydrolyzing) [Planctomycetia bacterium]
MCGIAGAAWSSEGTPVSAATLERMTSAIRHRGPDDAGTYFSKADTSGSPFDSHQPATSLGPAAALGFRRLSIIDLSTGHQPLANEDNSVWIVFNGEIYNYRELRADLEARGHTFRTNTDTECIVHLYEELGPDCVQRLRGMFAFAIWDDRRKRLLLARDRVGKKPLFYRLDRGQLTFASELKALLLVPGAPRRLNVRAIDSFLCYQYVPHPDCMLLDYHKLPPGHVGVFENGMLEVRRYWEPPFEPGVGARFQRAPTGDTQEQKATSTLETCSTWSADRWRKELRSTLTEAVRLRMRSDVPLGAFLSGGIDSTIITGLMQEHSERPVHTFSIGFPVKEFDERSFAREAAAHLKTDHHELVVEPNALDMLPKLLWHYDEPFADSSAIPTMYLSEMTRQHVTVALSGDGGDEMFCGYTRYLAVKLASRFDRLPGVLKKLLTAKIWQKIPSGAGKMSLRRRAKRFLRALGQTPEQRYLRWVGIFEESQRQELYTPEFARSLGDHNAGDFLLDAYAACPSRDFVTRTTCADILSYLPCDILTKVDVASMAFSVECRSPFLDQEVIELAARMPIELKLHGNQGKQILIDTFADLLPPSIQRRRKMGFGVPLANWFRGELKPFLRDVLFDSRTQSRGFFEPAAVQRLFDEHQQQKTDHSHRLWALLCLELWQRMFLDAVEPPANL